MATFDETWRRIWGPVLLVGLVVLCVAVVFGVTYWFLRLIVLAAWTVVDRYLGI